MNEEQKITQTIEMIGLMQHALANMCEEVLPKNREMFAIMAEGPLDELQRLIGEVNAYVGKTLAPLAALAEAEEAEAALVTAGRAERSEGIAREDAA